MSAPPKTRTSGRPWRRGGTLAGRQRRDGWVMVAPTTAAILALGVFPLVYSLTLSFRRWDLQNRDPAHPFVGFANYADAVADSRIWAAFQNTLLITLVGVGLEFLLGLGLALVLIDELRGKRFVIPLLMLPVMMVPVVVALSWRLLWDAQYGPVNHLLGVVSGRDVTIAWLAEKDTAMVAILTTEIWQWTPFMFLILLAGLAGVNAELYDAAALDGAGWWHALLDITLPELSPVIAVAILFRALDAFKIFDVIFLFTQGGPGTSTETLSWYIYLLGLKSFRLGYAAAVSYLVVIFLTLAATAYAARFLRGEPA